MSMTWPMKSMVDRVIGKMSRENKSSLAAMEVISGQDGRLSTADIREKNTTTAEPDETTGIIEAVFTVPDDWLNKLSKMNRVPAKMFPRSINKYLDKRLTVDL